jgi:tetratricopeptide (TPR) repeat protein
VVVKCLKILSLILVLLLGAHAGPSLAHASLDELIEYASDLIKRNPTDPETILKRARLRLEQGNIELALSDIKAAEAYADPVETAYVLGLYFVAEAQHRQAIDAFGTYLSRYPGFTPAILARAKSHAALGHTDFSIRDYQYLLSVSKEPSPDYYLELARLESRLEPCGIHMALKSLDRGMDDLGLLVSLQVAAIDYELERKAFDLALARHETLRPWLGKTEQWKLRWQRLSARSLAKTTAADVVY